MWMEGGRDVISSGCGHCLPMRQRSATRRTLQDIVQVQERLLVIELIVSVSLRRRLRRRLPLPAR